MLKARIALLFLLVLSSFLYGEAEGSGEWKPLTHELIPQSKTIFSVIDLKTGKERIVDLTGKDFILVSVREPGSDGRFYAVDKDGTVWWSGPVTSGTPEYRSPSGVFSIIEKKRYHMSKDYPDESGVNNMDFMMKFTRFGHALHKGSVDWLSHGCIHIDPKDVPVIYRWSRYGMPVVVTRHSYIPFAREDLRRIYVGR
jgi:lipoprotein-anchoring transpeptidase ErfK/SrfK